MEQAPWAVYERISYARKPDGTIDTLGVERQDPPCRELVARKGGHVAKVFIDNDRSAFKGTRPDFEEMLSWAREGRVRGIAVWDCDRLSRNPDRDNLRIIELAEKFGVELATVCGEYDLSTSSGRMMFRIAGALARRESEHKAERLMLWNDQRVKDGMPHAGGTRPFGFHRDGVQHDPAEAALVREAAGRVLEGESMGAIVHDWHDREIHTPTGKPFHTTTLRRVLTNPRIAGLRVHRGEVIGGATWEPIISRGDFERLRALFSGRPRQKLGRPHSYPYSGLLRCGHKGCGGRMTGSSRGATQKAYGCERCDRTWITAGPVEAFLDEAVIATLAGEEFAASLHEQLRAWAAEDPATAAQLAADKRELAELARLKGERNPKTGRPYFTIEEWLIAKAPIEERIAQAEARLASKPDLAALADVADTEDEVRAQWTRWSVEKKRRVLRAILEQVTVLSVGRGGRHQAEDRLRPRWRV